MTRRGSPSLPTIEGNALYNVFTKSYLIRYVVHASLGPYHKTLCGREIAKTSRERFNSEVKGSCKRCIHAIEVQNRIHRGWRTSSP